MRAKAKEVGQVVELARYPVKSMKGEVLSAARVGWHGVAGDRRYAFRKLGNRTGLPWLSARDCPSLVLYRGLFENPENVDESKVTVVTPDGAPFDFYDPNLASRIEMQYKRTKIEPAQLWRGTYDSMDVSIITKASIASLGRDVGATLEVERFRANVVIESSDSRDYPEDKWIGELLLFGDRPDSARVRVNRKDLRCMVINLDPSSGKQDPRIMKTVVATRRNFLGAYGVTERPGTMLAGDTIYLLKD